MTTGENAGRQQDVELPPKVQRAVDEVIARRIARLDAAIEEIRQRRQASDERRRQENEELLALLGPIYRNVFSPRRRCICVDWADQQVLGMGLSWQASLSGPHLAMARVA